jgi:hypothetical protein
MATTTTNFGWDIPQSTDLVKDGATAIAALGQDIDTAFIDLKGGTTGQVLAKASGTDLDFSWVAQDDSNAIQNAIVDAKGDLISATAADTPARLAVGTNGQVLTADSTTATGLKWGAVSSGALTLIRTQSFSNVASQAFDDVFSSTYLSYLVVINNIYGATGSDDLQLQLRYAGPTTQTSLYYGSAFSVLVNGSTSVTASNNASQMTIALNIGSSGAYGSGQFYVSNVGNGSLIPCYNGQYTDPDANQIIFGGQINVARAFTGFLLKSSSSNITGSVSIYGLATA